jgi:hypothetical protein
VNGFYIQRRLRAESVVEVYESPLNDVAVSTFSDCRGLASLRESDVDFSSVKGLRPSKNDRLTNRAANPEVARKIQVRDIIVDGHRRHRIHRHIKAD